MKIVIALGGNALGDTPSTQKENAKLTAKGIVDIIESGNEVVITHGNGPQVGLINLAFTEGGKINNKVYEMPFSECGSMSQGYIGFHLQNAILNELKARNINKNVASIITQVEVDKIDKAFANPTKPIGSFYSKEEALKMPYVMKEDASRGYRRVIASPKPIKIVELNMIKQAIDNGNVVIACGGGGIPVINNNGIYEGIDAVIDKDYASSLLASLIDADVFLIVTAIDEVCLNFHQENEIKLHKVTVKEMEKYNEEGHFSPGSMKPKVEAGIDFVKNGKNRKAIITSINQAVQALNGKAGTTISK